jgi:hypothetical protein
MPPISGAGDTARVRSRWLYLAAGLIVLALSTCGGKDDKLAEAEGRDLLGALNRVEQGVTNGDCGTASTRAVAFKARVKRLDGHLNASLSDALSAGARRLERLVATQCKPLTPPPAPVAPPPTVNREESEEEGD